ncbi:MAG: hypothetical protein V7636_2338 [Actinomycetota bacterium]|jgi:hypothetical protein
MEGSDVRRAVEAAKSAVADSGMHADDAVVLHNSNRIAVHLTPCDVLARVGPLSHEESLDFELEVGRQLAGTDAPVGGPDPRTDPRVFVRDEFAMTLWTYCQPVPPSELESAEYADSLARLHAGLREIEVQSPHFTDRVAEALTLVGDVDLTPELREADRALLNGALHRLSTTITDRGAAEQVLHGEPHPGNVLRTRDGLLFIDLQTCCRGPVEFDIAHALLPHENGRGLTVERLREHYPGADGAAIEQSRILIWAMITAWRWDKDDELPNRDHWRLEGLNQLRQALDRAGLDVTGDD